MTSILWVSNSLRQNQWEQLLSKVYIETVTQSSDKKCNGFLDMPKSLWENIGFQTKMIYRLYQIEYDAHRGPTLLQFRN